MQLGHASLEHYLIGLVQNRVGLIALKAAGLKPLSLPHRVGEGQQRHGQREEHQRRPVGEGPAAGLDQRLKGVQHLPHGVQRQGRGQLGRGHGKAAGEHVAQQSQRLPQRVRPEEYPHV